LFIYFAPNLLLWRAQAACKPKALKIHCNATGLILGGIAKMVEKVCTSCKVRITNDSGSTIFNCPECGKSEIVRCGHCRKVGAKYTCPECGFSGPN
jgi:hypothetical protein